MLVDANMLLFAVNEQAQYHERAAEWLTKQLSARAGWADTDFARFEELHWENPLR